MGLFGVSLSGGTSGNGGSAGASGASVPNTKQYIIQFGNVRKDTTIGASIRQMEAGGFFDGTVLRIGYADPFGAVAKNFDDNICYPYSPPYSVFATAKANLIACPFERFTENFIRCNSPTGGAVNVFDSAACEAYVNNFRMMSRLAEETGMRGLLIDNEHYSGSIFWTYTSQPSTYTFAQYQAAYYELGYRVMEAVQSEGVKVVVLVVSYEQLKNVADLAALTADNYSLLPKFQDGMHDACWPTNRLVNFNEEAYANQSDAAFDADMALQTPPTVPWMGSINYSQVHEHGLATFLDSPGSGFDYAVPANNFNTPAIFAANVVKMLARVPRYCFVFTNQPVWKGWGGTVGLNVMPDDYEYALQDVRVTVGIDLAWTPLALKPAALYEDTSLSAVIAAAAIDQWNDTSGNARHLTQTGGNRPVKTNTGLGGAYHGAAFTPGSSHYMLNAALGVALSGTNLPVTMVCVAKSNDDTPAAATYMAGCGVNGSANPILSWRQSTSTDVWANRRVSDIGSSAQYNSTQAGTVAPKTSDPFIFISRSTGSHQQLSANNFTLATGGADYLAQEVGAQTFTRFTMGCACDNTFSGFWDGTIVWMMVMQGFLYDADKRRLQSYLSRRFGGLPVLLY